MTITSGRHVFEIIESVPCGYQVWNIGKNMKHGFLPLAQVDGNRNVNLNTLKAIEIEGAQTILEAIGGGQNTIVQMETYIKRYKNAKQGTWPHKQVEKMKEALKVMYLIKWQ